jgi:O-antigen/teichoic acid export membrane protein
MDTSLFMARLKTWGIKGGLSVLDQGLYSGANFVMNILLARWLLPSHYGVFSIAFAVYLFAYQIHNAIIIEPMSVLGLAKMHHRLPNYLRDQIKIHFVVSLLAGFAIMVIGLIVIAFDQILGRVIIILGMVLSLILLPLLTRRIFYLFRKPQFALLGSAVYTIFLLGGLWLAYIFINISVDLAFPLIGLAGLTSGVFLIIQIPQQQSDHVSFRDIWFANWNYGKWLVYSSILIALAAQVQIFIVGGLLGLKDAGAFRALQNFIQPVILFFAAISAFLLPSLSYDFGKGTIAGLKRKGKYLFALFIIVSLGFELLLIEYGSALEAIIYGGRFSSYVHLLPVWGLVPIAGVLTYVFYFLLQSIQQPGAILIGSIVWSATSAILSVIFSMKWGIAGAVASVVAGYLFSGIAFAFLYQYYISRSNKARSR